jgi:predicted membrane chloride channel (bestrophin family)
MSTELLSDHAVVAPAARRRRLELVYDALAGVSVLSVAVALYFGAVSFGILGDFVERNELWAERQFAIADLQRAATFLIAPGNDVLQTNDVAKARAIRDRALSEFDAALKKFEVDLTGLVPADFADQMVDAFAMLEHEREMMIATSDKVFAAVTAGRGDEARLAMVAMDQRLFELTAVFSEFNRIFHEIQRTEFATQEDYARKVERYRYVFAGLVFLITGGAIVYGARLRRKMKSAE